MDKYRVVCQNCQKLFGTFDKPDIEMPTKCDACGGGKIATEKVTAAEIEQLDIDVVIFNKRTGVSKTCGFFIPKEKLEKNHKNLNKMRAIFAEELATAIHTVIVSDALLVDLIGDVKRHEI